MRKYVLPVLAVMLAVSAEAASDVGVLVMAHGGKPDWEREVLSTLAPLRKKAPVEVAFGMAAADTLQTAVTALEGRAVRKIVVVRLFMSGESFREATEQVLGLKAGAPPRPKGHHGHAGHGGHSMAFWRVESKSSFALTDAGLMESPLVGKVLARRARDLSKAPAKESVLILGHGPEDDAENARWLRAMDEHAEAVRKALPFRSVAVETLREDWPEKRAAAEKRICSFIEQAQKDGGKAIVIPFRVQGFGPYAKVLAGLSYVSDGKGLVPDPAIARWIEQQATHTAKRMKWPNPFRSDEREAARTVGGR